MLKSLTFLDLLINLLLLLLNLSDLAENLNNFVILDWSLFIRICRDSKKLSNDKYFFFRGRPIGSSSKSNAASPTRKTASPTRKTASTSKPKSKRRSSQSSNVSTSRSSSVDSENTKSTQKRRLGFVSKKVAKIPSDGEKNRKGSKPESVRPTTRRQSRGRLKCSQEKKENEETNRQKYCKKAEVDLFKSKER